MELKKRNSKWFFFLKWSSHFRVLTAAGTVISITVSHLIPAAESVRGLWDSPLSSPWVDRSGYRLYLVDILFFLFYSLSSSFPEGQRTDEFWCYTWNEAWNWRVEVWPRACLGSLALESGLNASLKLEKIPRGNSPVRTFHISTVMWTWLALKHGVTSSIAAA